MARELKLHRLDVPHRDPSTLTQKTAVEVETERKLWWYIASQDWLLAFNSGPTEGVYSVMPQHTSVREPRNIHARDLLTATPGFERPRDEPTNMAYYFLRIKLAEVCREAVDSMLMQQPEAVPYEEVHKLDAKFVALTAGLPRFLQLDVPPESIKREYGDGHRIQIGLQRALANLMISLRRCKFHLPFLIRYKTNPRYAFSRGACLDSAQKLLEVRRVFLDDSSWHTSSFLRLLGIYRFVFYAAMVFVMDLCINSRQAAGPPLSQVQEALKMVTEEEGTSRTATLLNEALRGILLKHGIRLPADSLDGGAVVGEQPENSISETPVTTDYSSLDTSSNDLLFDLSEFELLWPDNLTDERFLDPQCWDGLINIDMRLI